MSSADRPMLELAIDTSDDESVREIELALADVEVERWPESRDILTILTVVSTAVSLVEALLKLKDHLLAQRNPPTVKVKNAERDEVTLIVASREDLEKLLAG